MFNREQDHVNAKVNAIVGACVRALVESGADDASIGAFAASHRTLVSELLGVDAAPPSGPPDLLALVRHAVRSELIVNGFAPVSADAFA